jgi:hypothetical protein
MLRQQGVCAVDGQLVKRRVFNVALINFVDIAFLVRWFLNARRLAARILTLIPPPA